MSLPLPATATAQDATVHTRAVLCKRKLSCAYVVKIVTRGYSVCGHQVVCDRTRRECIVTIFSVC
jgi:hypothetical protein